MKMNQVPGPTPAPPEDPFEPPKPNLLITKALIAGIPATVLIDDGDEINRASRLKIAPRK